MSHISADFSTADGTADANDYQAASGQVSISAGQLSADVVVTVLGDMTIELDEDFTVGLANPVNARLGQAIGVGQITNDDFPLLSIVDAAIADLELSMPVLVRVLGDDHKESTDAQSPLAVLRAQ